MTYDQALSSASGSLLSHREITAMPSGSSGSEAPGSCPRALNQRGIYRGGVRRIHPARVVVPSCGSPSLNRPASLCKAVELVCAELCIHVLWQDPCNADHEPQMFKVHMHDSQ